MCVMGRKKRPIVTGILSCWAFATTVNADDTTPLDLSLQQLLDIEVTSVSKQAEPLSNAAAAIYVITAEEIGRRGFRSIPQALRDVPGLHVAQIDSEMGGQQPGL